MIAHYGAQTSGASCKSLSPTAPLAYYLQQREINSLSTHFMDTPTTGPAKKRIILTSPRVLAWRTLKPSSTSSAHPMLLPLSLGSLPPISVEFLSIFFFVSGTKINTWISPTFFTITTSKPFRSSSRTRWCLIRLCRHWVSQKLTLNSLKWRRLPNSVSLTPSPYGIHMWWFMLNYCQSCKQQSAYFWNYLSV